MGSLTENNDNNNNIHAKVQISSAIVELLKGEQMAIQLHNLLHKDDDDHGGDDVAPVSAHDLALKIFTSFTDTLSALTPNKAGPVKHRRGCYKKRRSSESWITITPGMGDGYAWRKYGQKVILNSQHPRCYYRCTNKYEQGCEATKQVQIISKENPISYQTTYFIHHTCTDNHHHTPICTRAPPPIVGPVDHNSLPFQESSHSKEDAHDDDYHCNSTNPMMMIKKEESNKQESPISEDLGVPGPARLPLDQWLDFIGPECFGYDEPNGAPLMGSVQEEGCHSRGLDLDVNDQFGDIDNLHFDEIF